MGTAAGAIASVGAAPPAVGADPSGCQLGNGVKHVVEIVFDNVHFFRDNPNVPSDLEQMPHLLNFLESNGTVFSNSHTPLIAHTADDSLTIYTGLYGDRHGQPVTNSYNTYNPYGSTDTATSFAYWTSPVADTSRPPNVNHDTAPSMTYSATVPAGGTPNKVTPAPWVPFTRAGCSVGDFSTANMVLENTNPDINTVFGAGSPEAQQLASDPDSFKDAEVADYIGVAVHCAQGDAICADAQAKRGNDTSPSPTARPDLLPDEPGGYDGYQGLFGARYVAPQLGAGSLDLKHNGYQVTNTAGNLVDLNGNEIDGAFLSGHPGFPGFSPTAAQTLAYVADMQEAGIPVTYGYISDTHDKKNGATGCTSPGNALGPGDACSVAALKSYDDAFNTFFQRLQADGITPANTEFMISAEENDQFAGANAVGRSVQPTPADCDGVTTPCTYSKTQIGELAANIKGLLSTTASSGTPFDLDAQGASLYVHGQPSADDPAVRQLERDTAAMTNTSDPYANYSGVPDEKIVKYQAGALEQRVLHMQTNDPLRTPTYSIFPMPDYFFGTSGHDVSINNGFAYDHGYYSPNIDITWAGIAGPGVAVNGVDGPVPTEGNESHDPNSTKTVPEASREGTWVEEADLRPTLLHLVGLTDDYQTDGQVITPALTDASSSLEKVAELGALYQQINSSVGEFATDTLIADSKALASGSTSDDSTYTTEQEALQTMADHRDRVAALMKATLSRAAMGIAPGRGELRSEMVQGRALLRQAAELAADT
ncbi:MAG TPA: hypothetical protein VGK78_20040 [Nocardioides sp.]|uniref:hypothetical protein n=1 Tax=Nocardioides sp. TaxID=35761 RepID=UPI002F3F5558